MWNQVLDNPGVPIYIRPCRMMHKNGNWCWLEGTFTNFLNDPNVNGLVVNLEK